MATFREAVLVIVLISVTDIAAFRCPLHHCESDLFVKRPDVFTLNHANCVDRITELGSCIQNSLKQNDICQNCEKDDFSMANKDYPQAMIQSICFRKQCKRDDLRACSRAYLQNIMMFHDTSGIDDFISCIDNWNPEMDHRVCLNALYYMEIPDSIIDPIAVGKQLLRDIKQGCDPMLAAVKCRKHLGPVQWRYEPGVNFEEYRKGADKAIEDTVNCMETNIKNYPCKTLETLLSSDVTRDVIKQQLARRFITPRRVDWPALHYEYCGNTTDTTSFFRK